MALAPVPIVVSEKKIWPRNVTKMKFYLAAGIIQSVTDTALAFLWLLMAE